MILGALILVPAMWINNDDSFKENTLVLMSAPPESQDIPRRIEIQKLTVL